MIDLDKLATLVPSSADVAIILGSGLGGFAEKIENAKSVKTSELPGYPVSTVAGHAGKIVTGTVGKTKVMAFQGRVHQYEGYLPEDVVMPVRLAHRCGAKILIVTNASGAFTTKFQTGDLLLIDDHINLQFRNPLRGQVKENETRWPDMCHDYDEGLKKLAEAVATELQIPLRRGTLAAVLGPNYETPAEAKMLATIGTDAGCMSTVPEVITAAGLGMKVLGISCITNSAAGISATKLTHEDVQKVAAQAAVKFQKLIAEILMRIPVP